MTIKPFDFIPKDQQSTFSQPPEAASQFVIGGIEGALTAPGTLGEFFQTLVDKLPGGKHSEKIRRGVGKFLFPQLSGKTLGEIREKEKEAFGEKLEPKTGTGRISRASGQFAGSSAILGPTSTTSFGLSALGGASGQTARELGLPESAATALEILTPAAGAMGKKFVLPHTEGSLSKTLNKSQLDFYNKAKEIGLSDKQITPLLQSEKKVKTLGVLAKKTPEAKQALFEAEKEIGSLYKPIKEKASSYGNLSQEQLKIFNENLNSDLKNLRKTVNPSEYKEEAISYLEKSLKNLEGDILSPKGEKLSYKFRTPEDIVNFFQDINEQGLWDKLKGPKETIKNFLNETDPKLGRMFETTNEAYSKIMKMKDQIGVGNYEKMLSFIEKAGLIGAVVKGLIFGGGWGISGAIIGENLTRKLATKMLFDPRYQNLLKSTIQAGKQNLPKVAQTLNRKLIDKIKEDFPEESENIDWNRLY